MITRDSVQGFIDGLKASGNDLSDLPQLVEAWLKTHIKYPTPEDQIKQILSDLDSYQK